MTQQLSPREKTLATIVGGIVFLLINFLLFSTFSKHHRRLKEELAAKASQLEVMRGLFSDRELWEQRDAWLDQRFTKITNESTAGVELLNTVKEAAKKHAVLIENPSLGIPQKKTDYVSVLVNLEAKSNWRQLGKFLFELQGPEKFVVVESVNLQVDPADKFQMRGKMRIAKWFAK